MKIHPHMWKAQNQRKHKYRYKCWYSDTDCFLADAPEAQKPGQPLNVTVDAVSGGWVIRWASDQDFKSNADFLRTGQWHIFSAVLVFANFVSQKFLESNKGSHYFD